MGSSCSCIKAKNETICQSVDYGRIKELTDKLLHNMKLHGTVIHIQAHIRGIIYRKRSNIIKSKMKSAKHSDDVVGENNSVDNTNITTISDEELLPLLQNYKPLEDNIKTILRKPIKYSNKAIYYGEWNAFTNMRHGRGIQIWADGSKYIGYWKNDKENIRGTLIDAEGEVYEGEWVDDNANGYGSYKHNDGARFEGFWKDDKQEGLGKETWPDGACYNGEYKEGKKCGKGKFIWTDGSEYFGDFYNNQIHGKGTYIWSDKREYTGDWKNNQMDGEGVFKWPDGRKYVGHYKDDKKDGYGIFKWNDGKCYKGYWKNGKQHGEGEFFRPKENIWTKGYWSEGKRVRWNDTLNMEESTKPH